MHGNLPTSPIPNVTRINQRIGNKIMNPPDFKAAIAASLQNGDRLAEDAQSLLEWDRFPTAYALTVLAQEEYAKAFLLSLVDAGALQWSADVRQALHDHVCKQLVSLILDYLSPDVDEFLRRHDLSRIGDPRPIFPSDVLDAVHVICHERIPRERERWWLDVSVRPLESNVDSVANGRFDRKKQDAIYVGIGRNGAVTSKPAQISAEQAKTEIERTRRIGDKLRPYDRVPGLPDDLDSEKLIAIFRLLTGGLTADDFKKNWWAQ